MKNISTIITLALCMSVIACIQSEGQDTQTEETYLLTDGGTNDEWIDDAIVECQPPQPDQRIWYDPSSNLVWQVNPSNEGMTWFKAVEYCDNLTISGYDDWRLPSIDEAKSSIYGCAMIEHCQWADDCASYNCHICKGCNEGAGPANGNYWPQEFEGPIGGYWLSNPSFIGENFLVGYYVGAIGKHRPEYALYARCVRG